MPPPDMYFTAACDRSKLYPPFRAKVEQLVSHLADAGTPFYGYCGFRTFLEQARLYFQGRTTPGLIVTRARAGFSAHNYGVAVDFALDGDLKKPGLQPDWNVDHYEPLAAAAEALGLEAGLHWATFRDAPHIQLPLKAHGVNWDLLRTTYMAGGMPAVWKLLDEKGPW